MKIHSSFINKKDPKITEVIRLENVKFTSSKFSTLLESLRIRGLVGASVTQPFAGPGSNYVWTDHIAESVQLFTSEHPYVSKRPMILQVAGTMDQIREVVSILELLDVEGIPEKTTTVPKIDIEYHTTLNEVMWNKSEAGYELKEDIRKVLVKGAEEFIEYVNIPAMITVQDITITGSSANYNWTASSDIDLHILVELSDVDPEYLDAVIDMFKAKKTVWNDEHNVTVHGIPVEYYVQDIAEKHHSTGIFSILNNEWVTQPNHEPPSVDDIAVKSKVKELQDKIDAACRSNKAAVVEAVYDKIIKMRKAALEKGGEFATDNIVFKQLRNLKYIEKLATCRTNTFDREISIEDEEMIYN